MTVYRPPNSNLSEWTGAINDLDEAIELVQAHNEYPNIVIGGDFNFRYLKWHDGCIVLHQGLSIQAEMF